MADTCYLVHESEEFGEGSVTIAVFLNKVKAEKYREVQQKLCPYDSFWVSEEPFKDNDFDENTKVANYYSYAIELDTPFNLEELDRENRGWEEAEPSIWIADNYVGVSKQHEYIAGNSIESYEKARAIALDYYNVFNGNKKEMEYKIVNE